MSSVPPDAATVLESGGGCDNAGWRRTVATARGGSRPCKLFLRICCTKPCIDLISGLLGYLRLAAWRPSYGSIGLCRWMPNRAMGLSSSPVDWPESAPLILVETSPPPFRCATARRHKDCLRSLFGFTVYDHSTSLA